MILQQHYSWSVQENAPKDTKHSRNKTILKIGHLPKVIAFAKLVILGQKLKLQKT